MEIKIIKEKISKEELRKAAQDSFGEIINKLIK